MALAAQRVDDFCLEICNQRKRRGFRGVPHAGLDDTRAPDSIEAKASMARGQCGKHVSHARRCAASLEFVALLEMASVRVDGDHDLLDACALACRRKEDRW